MSVRERSALSRRRPTSGILVPIAVAAVLVLVACQAETQRLTIATGGTGGVYFPLGGGLAQEPTENIDGVQATAQETSASVDNMRLIGRGGAHIAFVLADTAADAVEGRAEPLQPHSLFYYLKADEVLTTGLPPFDVAL